MSNKYSVYSNEKVEVSSAVREFLKSPDDASIRATFGDSAALAQLGVDIAGTAGSDFSGWSVDINKDGNIIAIGAPFDNNANGADAGHVRIYQYIGNTWVQLGSEIIGEAPSDQFGYSVSLNSLGNKVAVGAPFNDVGGLSSGRAYLYEYDGSAWNLTHTIDGANVDDRLGVKVALNGAGNVIAAGAHKADGANGTDSGQVIIHTYDVDGPGFWQIRTIDGEAASDNFGDSISLNDVGDVIAVGSYKNDGAGTNAGHVRVYTWDGVSWSQRGVDIDGITNDQSGYSVDLNAAGDIVAIGGITADGVNANDSGDTRIYQWNGASWNQLGSDIDGEAQTDYSGYSVSLNSAGNTVAVGAIYNDGNGTSSGHVRIYQYKDSDWVQVGDDIDGSSAGEQSGWSVSLNGLGNTLVVGAPYNDDGGTNSGEVKVYRFNNSHVHSTDEVSGLDTLIDSRISEKWGSSKKDDKVIVTGAGETTVNGTYVTSSTSYNGKTQYELLDPNDNVTVIAKIRWEVSDWRIVTGVSFGDTQYLTSDNPDNPWDGTWTTGLGAAPVPTLSVIEKQYIEVTIGGVKYKLLHDGTV